eukprot:m.127141 g.127141  ORF g.127141 m.127141 type:complete len:741 (-) comp15794_c0_seq3:99-2321(-)
MKFGQELSHKAIPEWINGYVNYSLLKKKVKAIAKAFPWQELNLHPSILLNPETSQAQRVAATLQPRTDPNSPTGFTINTLEDSERRCQEINNSVQEAQFIAALNKELEKVNRFFQQQIEVAHKVRRKLDLQLLGFYADHAPPEQAQVALTIIRDRLEREQQTAATELLQSRSNLVGDRENRLRRRVGREESDLHQDTKLLADAYEEFYRLLDLLISFQELNRLAFVKILKKHDKITGLTLSSSFMATVDQAPFRQVNMQIMLRHVEQEYTQCLAYGNRSRAMEALRVPIDPFTPFDFQMFRLGAWLTVFLFSVIVLVVAMLASKLHFPEPTAHFTMFRGLLYPTLMTALIAIDVYIWKKHHINYLLIFGLDHRSYTNHIDMMERAGVLAALWSLTLFLYVFQDEAPTVPSPYLPVTLMGVMLLYLLLPGSTRPHKATRWALNTAWRMVAAPFYHVRFEDFWLADQFNSIIIFVMDVEFMICYLSLGQFEQDGEALCRSSASGLRPTIAALPAWWRFAQCWRRYYDTGKKHHLVNAGKYFSTLVVVTFSSLTSVANGDGQKLGTDTAVTAFFTCWIGAALVNTCYSLYWDLVKDWGLFSKEEGVKHRFLRKQLLYPVRVYYLAIVLDAVLRLGWTLSVSVGFFGNFFGEGLVALLAFTEMCRRFMWNCFRLENEHLNNCGEFRATRKVELPFELIEEDEDLVENSPVAKVCFEDTGTSVALHRTESAPTPAGRLMRKLTKR